MVSNNILIFVEDPGAANFILDFPDYSYKNDVNSVLIATGPAIDFLKSRNTSCIKANSLKEIVDIIVSRETKLVLVGTSQNPDSLGLSLISYCREHGIETSGFVDMEVDSHLRFCGNTNDPLMYSPDYLIVPNESTFHYFSGVGFKPDKILISGNPNYNRVIKAGAEFETLKTRQRFREIHNIGADKKIVTIIGEHLNNNDVRMLPNERYLLSGRDDSFTRTEIVIDEILDAFSSCSFDPFRILRLHPKNSPEEYKKYKEEIDLFSYAEDPLEIIYNSDFVFGMTSMLVMESFLLGKNPVSVLPTAEEKNWAPHTKYDYVPIVYYRQNLIDIVSSLIKGEIIEGKNKFEYVKDSNKEIFEFLFKRMNYERS